MGKKNKNKDTAILHAVIRDDPSSAQGSQKSPNLDLSSLYCAHSCLLARLGLK